MQIPDHEFPLMLTSLLLDYSQFLMHLEQDWDHISVKEVKDFAYGWAENVHGIRADLNHFESEDNESNL